LIFILRAFPGLSDNKTENTCYVLSFDVKIRSKALHCEFYFENLNSNNPWLSSRQ